MYRRRVSKGHWNWTWSYVRGERSLKINNLKINGFGKLKDREIKLEDGINIVYGENEAGKSSLLKFITSMFYGASKNKNGKDISDFEKYKPWQTEEFSGKIEYTLDSGESFEVYREFKKKNPARIKDDEAKWDRVPTKIKMDEVLSVDFQVTSPYTPDKSKKEDK